MDSHEQYITATIQGSLYGTAKRLNIPYKLIQQMSDIFNWEINLAKDVQSGDRISIIYEASFIDDTLIRTGDILAVSYTNRGRFYQAIRHLSASGDYDYFTPEGRSLKKAFSRYPVKFSHISSTFNSWRKHPILHYSRPHKGIDLAAPIGTPIRATGDGRIENIGRQNGYGNMVKISHKMGFTSLYGHLLRFQKGLAKGDFVKRGQIIGFVGQTGLASGPHCHYEFHINHHPKNPTTVDLPHAAPVPSREIAKFKVKTNQLLAQLKLYEEGSRVGINSGNRSADTG
jgi:murein DD-endopeptidase MepM/ murein hydrolase activator NlpD